MGADQVTARCVVCAPTRGEHAREEPDIASLLGWPVPASPTRTMPWASTRSPIVEQTRGQDDAGVHGVSLRDQPLV